jgi:hypothetical protein
MTAPFHPPLPPDLAPLSWMAFSLDTPEELAAASFQTRHGAHPDLILESLNNLLVGPVPGWNVPTFQRSNVETESP